MLQQKTDCFPQIRLVDGIVRSALCHRFYFGGPREPHSLLYMLFCSTPSWIWADTALTSAIWQKSQCDSFKIKPWEDLGASIFEFLESSPHDRVLAPLRPSSVRNPKPPHEGGPSESRPWSHQLPAIRMTPF